MNEPPFSEREARVKVSLLGRNNTVGAKLMTVALCGYRNGTTGRCDPSTESLADTLGVSERTARYWITEAEGFKPEKHGAGTGAPDYDPLIEVQRKRGCRNRYVILDGSKEGNVLPHSENPQGRQRVAAPKPSREATSGQKEGNVLPPNSEEQENLSLSHFKAQERASNPEAFQLLDSIQNPALRSGHRSTLAPWVTKWIDRGCERDLIVSVLNECEEFVGVSFLRQQIEGGNN